MGELAAFYVDKVVPGYYEKWRYHPNRLKELCDYGAEQVEKGTFDAIRFDLFNNDEVEIVRAWMKEKHPKIVYQVTVAKGNA